MRGIVEVVGTVAGSIRFIVAMFFLCILGLGLILTIGAGVVAPQAADKVAERAERAHDRALEAARNEARNRSYASQGWGYDDGRSTSSSASQSGTVDPEGEAVGGWGN